MIMSILANIARGFWQVAPSCADAALAVCIGVFDFQPYLDASGDTNASPDNALQLANAYNVSGNNALSPDELAPTPTPPWAASSPIRR